MFFSRIIARYNRSKWSFIHQGEDINARVSLRAKIRMEPAVFTYHIDNNLVLRLPEDSDAEAIFALFERDREYLTFWNDWPKHIRTVDDCKEFTQHHRRSYAEEKAIPAAMIYEGQFAGISELEIQDRSVVRKGELSYWIGETYQGKGIVTRSCEVLLNYAFNSLELNRIFLRFKHIDADNENIRSRRVAERLGFIQEGVQRQGGVARGQFMDMIVYSLLAKEWRVMQRSHDNAE